MLRWIALAAALGALACASPAAADDIKYKPVNPSFGGNPFTGNFLIDLARIQNPYEEPVDPIAEFEESLTRRLLARAAGEIEDRIFGEDPENEGTIPLDDLTISFERVGDIIILTITDLVTGGVTVIEIPAPGL